MRCVVRGRRREKREKRLKTYTLKRRGAAAEPARNYRVDYEGQLNQEQLNAVTAARAPLLIIAGAGSGKTRTVTYRVARFIEDGVAPSSIMLVTFTNRAAREMTGRVDELLPGMASRIWGGTFHSMAASLLRRHAEHVGYRANFGILDPDDAGEVMSAAVTDVGVDVKQRRFPKEGVLVKLVSAAIATQTPIVAIVEERYAQFIEEADTIAACARRFMERKREMNLMDFDDLLLNWKRLLTENEAVAASVRAGFSAILVDEYQDTNRLQGDIVDLMAAEHGNVTVVGDDAQSIYAFRGAHYANIFKFNERWNNATTLYLTTNYRSTPQVIEFANRVISFNREQFEKQLHAIRKKGELPAVVPCRDVYQQAEFIAERILDLHDEGVPFAEMAVLYRAHSHALELQVELSRRRIPYIVRSGVRFFEQAHVKDVLSYLRVVHNPGDEISFKRVVRLYAGIGGKTAETIWRFVSGGEFATRVRERDGLRGALPKRAAEGFEPCRSLFERLTRASLRASPAEAIGLILDEHYREYARANFENPNERIEDLEQLCEFAARFDSLDAMLGELMLLTTIGGEDEVSAEEPDDYLTLSSVHQAKGLEWRAVFVPWVSEGRFPSVRALEDDGGEEEERRLFYVAATRAKDWLTVTYPLLHVTRDYESLINSPSRFLTEVQSLDGELGPAFEKWTLAVEDAPDEPPRVLDAPTAFLEE